MVELICFLSTLVVVPRLLRRSQSCLSLKELNPEGHGLLGVMGAQINGDSLVIRTRMGDMTKVWVLDGEDALCVLPSCSWVTAEWFLVNRDTSK